MLGDLGHLGVSKKIIIHITVPTVTEAGLTSCCWTISCRARPCTAIATTPLCRRFSRRVTLEVTAGSFADPGPERDRHHPHKTPLSVVPLAMAAAVLPHQTQGPKIRDISQASRGYSTWPEATSTTYSTAVVSHHMVGTWTGAGRCSCLPICDSVGNFRTGRTEGNSRVDTGNDQYF
jgi:hypothetical protein